MFVRTVDLYCFGDDDPELLLPQRHTEASGYVAAWLAKLDPDDVQQIAGRLRGFLEADGGRSRRVSALATYLPGISAPPSGPDNSPQVRAMCVSAMKNLLRLADQLEATCVEIVAGPNFLRRGERADEWEACVGSEHSAACRRRLCASLAELEEWMAREEWGGPIGLAVEIEPGLSYGINSGREAKRLFADLEETLGDRPQFTALNLDIGHAWLLSKREPELRVMLWDDFLGRIAHAHISRHIAAAHFADQPVDERDLDVLREWLELFMWSQEDGVRPVFGTGAVAVELEAAVPPMAAVKSYANLEKWLAERIPGAAPQDAQGSSGGG